MRATAEALSRAVRASACGADSQWQDGQVQPASPVGLADHAPGDVVLAREAHEVHGRNVQLATATGACEMRRCLGTQVRSVVAGLVICRIFVNTFDASQHADGVKH